MLTILPGTFIVVLATWESELYELGNKLQGLSTAIFKYIYMYLNVDQSQC